MNARRPAARRSIALACITAVLLATGGTVAGTASAAKSGTSTGVNPDGVLKVGDAFNVSQGVTSLDPRVSFASGDIVHLGALYAPLMTLDRPHNKYKPYMASSVQTPDPRTVKIVLRDDAKFDDGRSVTAADAKATLDAMVANVNSKTPPRGLNPAIGLATSVTLDGPKSYTVVFSQDIVGTLYELLIGREFMVVPANAGVDQNTRPVGNGAFRFVSSTPGQQITMEKSPTFFRAKKVRLKGIQFLNLGEGTPQRNALLAGDIDITAGSNTGGLDISGFQSVGATSGFKTASYTTGQQFLMVVMCKSNGAFFQDERLRQALAYGTNRAAIATAAYGSLGVPASQFWLPSSPNYVKSIAKEYAYNPAKAKKILKDMDFKEGSTVNMTVTSQIPVAQTVGLILKQQWGDLGINVNLVPTTDISPDFLIPAQAGNPVPSNQSAVHAMTRTDAQKLTYPLGPPPNIQNVCSYTDPAITDAITKLRSLAPNSSGAVTEWQAIARHLADTNPLIPLAFIPLLYGWSDEHVGGVKPKLLGALGLSASRYDMFYIKKTT